MKQTTKVIVAGIGILLLVAAATWAYTTRISSTDLTATNTTTTTQTPTDTETSPTTTTNCGLTKAVTEGPYYVSGTSELAHNNLNYDSLSGTAIQLAGHVYAGADGTTPVKNAKIEVWQADDSGSYHPNANGAASSYSADQISLRGYDSRMRRVNIPYLQFTLDFTKDAPVTFISKSAQTATRPSQPSLYFSQNLAIIKPTALTLLSNHLVSVI